MAYLANCDACMRNTTKQQRQVTGCGYEPPIAARELEPWMPPISGAIGYQTGKATKEHPRGIYAPDTCVGYTSKLPEVREVSRASSWLKRGDFRAFVGDEAPHEHLIDAVDIHDGAAVARDAYYMTPSKDGGGAS